MDLCAGKKWTHVDIFVNKFSYNTPWEVIKCRSYVEMNIAISETCFACIAFFNLKFQRQPASYLQHVRQPKTSTIGGQRGI